MLILWILLSIAAALAVWLVFWSLVSFFVNRSAYHKQFIAGSVPKNPPDGFYQGTAHILFDKQTPWLGKSFVAADNLGFNIFMPHSATLLKVLMPLYKKFSPNANGDTDAFYFQTRTDAGLKDKMTNVIKLDYDAPENPLPIRIILDEIVEVAPDRFLGKIHLKVFPRFYSTIGYFGLEKGKSQAPSLKSHVL
jgi:hypothetical protein